MQVPRREDTKTRDLLILGGLFVSTILGLAGLSAATGWEETRDGIARLAGAEIVLLLALSLVNYGFRGLRWHLFARKLGVPTTLRQDLRHFFGGFAMSATPGRVGELIRMRWLRRETGWSFERTAPLMLADRASDLVALALILVLALALSADGIAGAVPLVFLALAAAWIATHPALLASIALWSYRATGRFKRLFARVRGASRSLAVFRSPWLIGFASGLGIVGWLAEGYAFYLLLSWMGADVGFWTATAVFIFSSLAGGLTGAPGGVGGAEAVMIALLSLEGVPLAVSAPATLIIRVTTLWFAIGLGLLIFPVAERASLKVRDAQI